LGHEGIIQAFVILVAGWFEISRVRRPLCCYWTQLLKEKEKNHTKLGHGQEGRTRPNAACIT
jgi:hypothetical protein